MFGPRFAGAFDGLREPSYEVLTKGYLMYRYLTLLRFSEQGAKDIKKSTARAAVFRDAAAKAGVKVEAQYWTTGAYDGAVILSSETEAKVLQCLANLAASGDVRTETMRALEA